MNRRMSDDRGAASAELALLTPLLVMIALLVLFAYRIVAADTAADAAAHAAARAATLERTTTAAQRAAEAAAADTVRTHDLACATHDLHLDTGGLTPSTTVTATFTCHADLADLTGLGLPGTRPLQGSATSVVDTYRGTP
jgi:Flp pilus assembly protein TadG